MICGMEFARILFLTILADSINPSFGVGIEKYSRLVLGNDTKLYREDTYLPAFLPGEDRCVDKVSYCKQYIPYCTTHRSSLKGICDKTCRYCGKNFGGPKVCEDRRTDCSKILYYCPALKGMCDRSCGHCGGEKRCLDTRSDCRYLKQYCRSHEDRMREYCPKTCGFCVGCSDEFTPGHCAMLKRMDKCYSDLRMQGYCRNTCGFCSLPKPENCFESKYGCCWDKKTPKETPEGRNCPRCRDKFKRLCKRLKSECISSKFVRDNCHKSCDYCPKVGQRCSDDPTKTHLCKFWEMEFDFCSRHREEMRHFCPATCKLDCTRRYS